jgi:hypothetical protein
MGRSHTSKALQDHLTDKYPIHHSQFFGEDEDGWQTVHRNRDKIIPRWLNGQGFQGGVVNEPTRKVEGLVNSNVNVWSMSVPERRELHKFWMNEIRRPLRRKFCSAMNSFLETKQQYDRARKNRISGA